MPSKQVPADTNPQKNKAELQRVVLSVYQQRSMLTNTAAFHSLLNHFKSTCSEAPTKNASMAYRFVQKKRSVLLAGRTMLHQITGNGFVLVRDDTGSIRHA